MIDSVEQAELVAPVEVAEAPPRLRLTSADYWAFVTAPENAARQFELFAGEVYEMPSPTPLHNQIILILIELLRRYIAANPDADGWIFADNNDLVLDEGYVVQADVSYFTKARLPKLPKRLRLAPDFVVEVASPSNSAISLTAKMRAYLKYGARLVWIIHPDTRTIWAYEPGADDTIILRVFEGDAVITGGAVLPGFTTTIAAVLPELPVEE